MTRLEWGVVGERLYETGVDRGVLYVNDEGVPWNGLVSVSESPSGGDATPYYLDGIKFLNRAATEDYAATIEAFSSPEEFDEVDGTVDIYRGLKATHQRRKSFGFSYRTKVGNDLEGSDHGYKIHLVYNALAAPASHAHDSINDSAAASTISWTITTTPPSIVGYKPTAHFVVDSRLVSVELLSTLEDILYGSSVANPRLPTTDELLAMFADYAVFKVTVYDNGIYAVEGSEVAEESGGAFSMDDPSIVIHPDGSFEID